MTNKKSINQKELDNRTHTTTYGMCCVTLLNSDWSKTLNQYLKICLETLG
jgi:hypothetical protein